MNRMIACALLLAVSVGLSAAALPGYPCPTVWGTVTNVVDGNRIVVEIVGSTTGQWIPDSSETIRYLGSFAPSAGASACGAVAAQVNYQMTFGRLVYLEFDQALRDPDGTVAAYVYLDGAGYSMVNAMLVAMGIAQTSPEAPTLRYASLFRELADTASRFGLGCSGQF
ncbi:MAG: hypothetical protein PHU43_09375 [Candidatus Bipolaricaulis sp.]|nr:hypothetical protein [Candidatus Bipolaricaulis sp.]